MQINITETILLEEHDVELDVDVTLNAEVTTNGIGTYEFWGQSGYDRGQTVVEDVHIESVSFDHTALPATLTADEAEKLFRSKIEAKIEDCGYDEAILEKAADMNERY